MVIINSVFWFYNFETLKLGDYKQDVIIYGVIIDRSDCSKAVHRDLHSENILYIYIIGWGSSYIGHRTE